MTQNAAPSAAEESGAAQDHSPVAYYVPTAFYMRFGDARFGDDIEINRGNVALFLHEYAHLMQDQCSLYGGLEFLHVLDGLAMITPLIRALPQSARLPLSHHNAASGHGALYQQIQNLRAAIGPRPPWTRDRNWAYTQVCAVTKKIFYVASPIPVTFMIAEFVDNVSGDVYRHTVGPWEIKEAYSQAITRLHSEVDPATDSGFEYHAVERIFARYFGRYSEPHIVAICHWSLQNEYPGETLFCLIERANEEFGGDLPDSNTFYEFCRRQLVECELEDRVEQVLSLLQEHAHKQYAASNDDYLGRLITWYVELFRSNYVRNISPSRAFPLDTFFCEAGLQLTDAEREAKLGALYAEFPLPCAEARSGKLKSYGASAAAQKYVLFLRSILQQVGQIWNGKATEWQCELYEACCKKKCPIKDEVICKSTPWDRGLAEPPCSYGAAARYLEMPNRRFTS